MRRLTTAAMLVLLTAGTAFAAEPPTPQPGTLPPSQAEALKLQQAKQARMMAAKQKMKLAQAQGLQAQPKPPSGDRLDRLIDTARTRASSALERMRGGSLHDIVDRYLPR